MRTAARPSPDRQALEAASEWFARLRDDRAGADETRQWQAWLSASTLHRQAWDAVMAVSARFDAIAGQAELDALTRAGQGRRRVLRAVALLAGAGGLGAAAWTQPVTRRHLADLRTDVGQTRHDTLPDGSRLWLDTASAVDLRFDAHVRRVVLIDGQAMIETQPDATAPARPFVLDLGHARLRALGTRFAVRRDGGRAWLDVHAGAVEIQPGHAPARQVQAGFGCAIDGNAIGAPEPLAPGSGAWTRGELVANAVPLADFTAELARYRRGLLTCAPDVADLPLVGVFRLADADRALRALEATLPVRARRVLPGWVRLESA